VGSGRARKQLSAEPARRHSEWAVLERPGTAVLGVLRLEDGDERHQPRTQPSGAHGSVCTAERCHRLCTDPHLSSPPLTYALLHVQIRSRAFSSSPSTYALLQICFENATSACSFTPVVLCAAQALDVQIDPAWTQHASFIAVGLIAATQMRGFLLTAMKFFNWLSFGAAAPAPAGEDEVAAGTIGGSNHLTPIVILLVSELLGSYFVASVVLMRMNMLPDSRMYSSSIRSVLYFLPSDRPFFVFSLQAASFHSCSVTSRLLRSTRRSTPSFWCRLCCRFWSSSSGARFRPTPNFPKSSSARLTLPLTRTLTPSPHISPASLFHKPVVANRPRPMVGPPRVEKSHRHFKPVLKNADFENHELERIAVGIV
jgi:hypothetical protein